MTHTELLVKPTAPEAPERINAEPETIDPVEQELPLARVLGERVRAEMQELWDLYPGRRQGHTTHIGHRIYDDEGLVTRYPDEHGVEETYFRTRVYGASTKPAFDPAEVVFVRVTTDAGEHEIFVNEAGDAAVRYHDSTDPEWRNVSYQDAENYIDELTHRVLVAAVRHGSRTPEEKALADAHAIKLLRERLPMFARPETSLE